MNKSFNLKYKGNNFSFVANELDKIEPHELCVNFREGAYGTFKIPYNWGFTRIMQFIESISNAI